MIVESSLAAIAVTLVSVFLIRVKDIAPDETVSPTAHLDERKSAIHESLRDLQFDLRTGKLFEGDYQASKRSLQAELAAILLQIRDVPGHRQTGCPSCGEKFSRPMRFCGNCGKAVA